MTEPSMSDVLSIIDDIFSGYSSWPALTVSRRRGRTRCVLAFLAWIRAIPAVRQRDGDTSLLECGRRAPVHLVVERRTEDDGAKRPEGVHDVVEAVGMHRRASCLGYLYCAIGGGFRAGGAALSLSDKIPKASHITVPPARLTFISSPSIRP